MTPSRTFEPDPKLDLVLERTIDVPVSLVWAAWTKPEHVSKWLTPAPWTVADCEIDLHPGGIFQTVMRSPDGEDYPNVGCFLEIIPNERLVFTDALLPGFRPSENPFSLRLSLWNRKGRAHGTPPWRSIAMRRDAKSTKRWASTRVGERFLISSWIASRRCDRLPRPRAVELHHKL